MPAPAPEIARPLHKADASSSYIFMVQHLIEKCIVFNMDRQQCVEALATHANIKPIITTTVWNELEKENKEFFSSYFLHRKQPLNKMLEETTARLSQQTLADHHSNSQL
eukprot:Gb_27193 [translate_table: standard]